MKCVFCCLLWLIIAFVFKCASIKSACMYALLIQHATTNEIGMASLATPGMTKHQMVHGDTEWLKQKNATNSLPCTILTYPINLWTLISYCTYSLSTKK